MRRRVKEAAPFHGRKGFRDGYLKYINSVTGRIHPDFFSLSTDTGRMNCRNPNIQNCFDSETEILTRHGFVPFPELQEGEPVAQWDNGEISFVEPLQYIDREYDGDMVQVESKHISLLMTPDHRCLLQKKDDSFFVVDAVEYPKDARQLNAGEFAFGEKHLTKAEATLLAATQADGYICDGGIEFTFVKARKFRRLMQAIKETGTPHSDYTKRDGRVNVRLLKSEDPAWKNGKASMALVEQMTTIDKRRLVNREGAVSRPETIEQLKTAVLMQLGLKEDSNETQ